MYILNSDRYIEVAVSEGSTVFQVSSNPLSDLIFDHQLSGY